jgi:hypothetical protein
MKLAPDTLLEIMAILQSGILEMKDISGGLRDLDLEERDGKLGLSAEYVSSREST